MPMLSRCVIALGALAAVSGTSLTSANWDEETAGKTAFIKFQAPWCGHCKSMKPAWDKLAAEYKGSKTVIIGDVDCTAEESKALCETHGVQGFPTIKSGDVSAMEDYQGGRDFDALAEHAKTLKPSCSPSNIDLCDDDKKKEIAALQKLSASELDAKIEEKDKESAAAEEHFQTELKKLQDTYSGLEKEKEAKIAAVKASGLGLMKAVKAANAKKDASSEEL